MLYLLKKLFFLCPHLRQFIAQALQTYLFIHVFILPRSDIFCKQFSVRCCHNYAGTRFLEVS